jgi:hypothetical protein
MAMRYEFKGDFEALSKDNQSFVHNELSLMLMYCGIGNLTQDTLDEVLYRCRELVSPINYKALKAKLVACTPFHCNVSTESRIDWYKRIESVNVKKYNRTWANNQTMEV